MPPVLILVVALVVIGALWLVLAMFRYRRVMRGDKRKK